MLSGNEWYNLFYVSIFYKFPMKIDINLHIEKHTVFSGNKTLVGQIFL